MIQIGDMPSAPVNCSRFNGKVAIVTAATQGWGDNHYFC